MLLSRLSFRSSLLLMLLAGGLNVLSFAPYGWWPLQILSLAALFGLWLREGDAGFSRRQAAWLGWAYSFAWLFGAVSWLLVAMTRFGGLPLALALPGLALLAGALALFAVLAAIAADYLRRRWRLSPALLALLVLPALWTLGEWLRGWVLTGFPWAISGYAHTVSVLKGYAPLLGVLGLSWLNALLAGAAALAISGRISRKQAQLLAFCMLLMFFAGRLLSMQEWTAPHGKPLSVSLLQGNVAQDTKFAQEHLNESLRLYHEMITAAPAGLVATPETALPMLSSQLPPDYLPRLNAFAQDTGSAVVVGLGVHDGGMAYSNSVLGFSRAHAGQAYRYDKHHLVPFGEFVPPGFRWLVDMMRIPLGDFASAGLLQPAMRVADQWVLPDICYENLFGAEIAQQLAAQAAGGQAATILLNSSNLAWYGDSIAMPQHLQISQMRALETGRPMLSVTNTGATAVIRADGGIQAQLPPLTRATLQASVVGRDGLTPYVRWGDRAVLAIVWLSLLLAYGLGRRAGRGLE